MKKKKGEVTIRSSAAEYLTYVASVGDQQDSIEMRYEDENIWLTQKMMATLDPPRAGSDEAFLTSVVRLAPNRIVYISCNPETLARDVAWLKKHRYQAEGCWGYDMFPFTGHVETICKLVRK